MNPVGGGGAGGGGGGAAALRDIMALRQQAIDQSQLLQQLREPGATQAEGVTPPDGESFADNLRTALNTVNDTQNRASSLSEAYEKGEVTDIAKVMLARQEAGLAFEATLQVRNRLLSAYQDIMRMGV